jgi:hypothetical protein
MPPRNIVSLLALCLLVPAIVAASEGQGNSSEVANSAKAIAFEQYNRVSLCLSGDFNDYYSLGRVTVIAEEKMEGNSDMKELMRAVYTRNMVRQKTTSMIPPYVIIFSGGDNVPLLGVRLHISSRPDNFVAEHVAVGREKDVYVISEATPPMLIGLNNYDWNKLSPEVRMSYLETRFVRLRDMVEIIRSRFWDSENNAWKQKK